MGYESEELYFNLGNAFYKSGNLPFAILNYERAKKLNPGDEDIQFNLKLTKAQVIDKITPVPKLFFIKWLDSITHYYSASAWGICILIFLWLTFLCAVVFIFFNSSNIKRLSFYFGIFMLIVTLKSIFFGYRQYQYEKKEFAILLTKSTYVKSAPDEQSTDLFILHEGVKMEVLDRGVENWDKIKLEDGKIGWILKESLEEI